MNRVKNANIIPFWLGLACGVVITGLALIILSYNATCIGRQGYDQLNLIALDGKPINLSQLKGKPLVVDYWATWCKPCIEEFTDFEQANNDYKGRISFIMIADNPADKVKKFVKHDTKLDFYVCREKLDLDVRPITLFYDKNHNLVAKHIGTMDRPQLLKYLKEID